MLASVTSELPPHPSPEDVKQATANLPSASNIAPFLSSLSNRIFFRVLQTDAQRNWLSRLSLLESAFHSMQRPRSHRFHLPSRTHCGLAVFDSPSVRTLRGWPLHDPNSERNEAAENANNISKDKVRIAAARGYWIRAQTKHGNCSLFKPQFFSHLMAATTQEAAGTQIIAPGAPFEPPGCRWISHRRCSYRSIIPSRTTSSRAPTLGGIYYLLNSCSSSRKCRRISIDLSLCFGMLREFFSSIPSCRFPKPTSTKALEPQLSIGKSQAGKVGEHTDHVLAPFQPS